MFRRLTALAALVIVMAWAGPAPAQQLQAQAQPQPQSPTPAATAPADPFTVTDVHVDITGSSAVEARDRAFSQAQRVALGQLMERLAGAGRVDTSGMSATEVGRLVQSIQVNQERTAPGRYIASLTVAFKPAEIRALLSSRGIAYTEPGLTPLGPSEPGLGAPLLPAGPGVGQGPVAPSGPSLQPVLVLPVLRTAQGPVLWDSPNPWHTAWLNFSGEGRLMPILVPLGDLNDVAEVSAERALEGDRSALATIAQRYGAGDVVVAVAEPRGNGLTVTVNRYGAAGGTGSTMVEVPGGGTGERLYADAVNRTADQLVNVTATPAGLSPAGLSPAGVSPTGLTAPGQPPAPGGPLEGRAQMLVLVPLATPGEWFQTQALLRNVANINATRLVSLSSREAILQLDYSGGEDQLRAALAQQGLTLQQGASAMELRRTGLR